MTGSVGLIALALLLVPATPAAAKDGCSGDLAKRLDCWAGRVGTQDAVVVTLHTPLALDGKRDDWKISQRKSVFAEGPLVVLVPAGHATGAGGTLLLVLAGDRLVAPDAEITRLDAGTVTDLKNAGACPGKVCQLVDGTGRKGKALRGQDLLDAGLAAPLDKNTDSVGTADGGSSPLLPALGTAALLLVLLAAFVIVVRRSRGPRPAYATVSPGSHAKQTPTHRATTETATVPAARRRTHGRDVGGPSGPSRTAVVRTELHPQGYVELDDCLYRAVWAEPEAPAPGPGARVEVTEGRVRDAGVLYAYGADDKTVRITRDRTPHGS
ncbi:hypothetical protein ACT1U9_10945 [Streptomyces sp. BR1]|uniref:hypothetical protein n=1 Tax=Streptomyces sp. BR1 TaxID=1592323 RepID=UPI00402B6464